MDKAKRLASQARYDRNRPAPITMRFSPAAVAWIDERRRDGESRGGAIKRLMRMPAELR